MNTERKGVDVLAAEPNAPAPNVTDAMAVALKRALPMGCAGYLTVPNCRAALQAALAAQPLLGEAGDYVMVPREPTVEILVAMAEGKLPGDFPPEEREAMLRAYAYAHCEACCGQGTEIGSDDETCPICAGTGEEPPERPVVVEASARIEAMLAAASAPRATDEILALVARWRREAATLRILSGVASDRGDLYGADENSDDASELDSRADQLEAALARVGGDA